MRFSLPAVVPHGAKSAGVIIVDEEAVVRGATASMLQSLGYRTEGVSTTAEARVLLAAAPSAYATVLLDGTLLEGAGRSDLIAMRGMRSELGVILSSGLPQSHFPALEGSAYLAKPYSEEQLLEALDAALPPS